MKEVWAFLRWQAARFNTGDWIWFVGCGFIGAGISASPERAPTLYTIGGLVMASLFVKWFIWDTARSQWDRYKREKAELFNTIKEGK